MGISSALATAALALNMEAGDVSLQFSSVKTHQIQSQQSLYTKAQRGLDRKRPIILKFNEESLNGCLTDGTPVSYSPTIYIYPFLKAAEGERAKLLEEVHKLLKQSWDEIVSTSDSEYFFQHSLDHYHPVFVSFVNKAFRSGILQKGQLALEKRIPDPTIFFGFECREKEKFPSLAAE